MRKNLVTAGLTLGLSVVAFHGKAQTESHTWHEGNVIHTVDMQDGHVTHESTTPDDGGHEHNSGSEGNNSGGDSHGGDVDHGTTDHGGDHGDGGDHDHDSNPGSGDLFHDKVFKKD